MKTANIISKAILVLSVILVVAALLLDIINIVPAIIAYIAYRLLNDCIRDLCEEDNNAATSDF